MIWRPARQAAAKPSTGRTPSIAGGGPAGARSPTASPRPLAQAYREAVYVIDAPTPVTLRVDQDCPALAEWARQQQVPAWGVFLTACNPRSRRLRPAANARRMRALKRALAQCGHTGYRAQALDPHEGWPAEPSVWIPGLPDHTGCALARRFGQNAFLWCPPHGPVQLIWTR